MTFSEIRQRIETLLHGWGLYPVAFDGATASQEVKAAQAAKTPWVRLTILHGDSLTASVSDKPHVRRPGLIACQIFTADNQGSIEAHEVADALTSLLQHYQDGDLTTLAASVQRVGPRDGFYQLNLTVPFRAG